MDDRSLLLGVGAAAGAAAVCSLFQMVSQKRQLAAVMASQEALLAAMSPRPANGSFTSHAGRIMDESEGLFALVVAGDIGGTNSRLSLYSVPALACVTENERPPGVKLFELRYKNDSFPSFVDVMRRFFVDAQDSVGATTKVESNVAACCLAVAGPVAGNRVHFTNRAWTIDGNELADVLRIDKVRLINDFVAQGYGILTLNHAKECEVLQGAVPVPGAPKVCIGAGTGLGECFLTAPEPGASYEVFPSEGGHAEFAPRVDPVTGEEEEFRLLQALIKRFKQKHRVSVERLVSGPGLENIYDFYASAYPDKVGKKVHAEYEAAPEKGRVVSENAGLPDKPGDIICHKTMHMFARAYGSEAGVAGLKWMPFGGMYLVGGITPKNMGWVAGEDGPFMKAFHDKGRVAPLLRGVPLYAVKVDDIGERGAHLAAVKLLAGARTTSVPSGAAYKCPEHDAAGHQSP